MQSHKSCRYAIFLLYYFQTSWWIEQMQSHISCMCVVFSNVSFHVSSQNACLNRCKLTRVADMRNFSIKWFSNVFWNCLVEQIQCHISCMCVVFSNVSFHMSSQIVCLNRSKVPIVADVRNFSIIIFKRLLKLPNWTDTKSHELHARDFLKR